MISQSSKLFKDLERFKVLHPTELQGKVFRCVSTKNPIVMQNTTVGYTGTECVFTCEISVYTRDVQEPPKLPRETIILYFSRSIMIDHVGKVDHVKILKDENGIITTTLGLEIMGAHETGVDVELELFQ
jgi:hypothetical protein